MEQIVMYFACALDDEYYVSPSFAISDTRESVKEIIKDVIPQYYDKVSWRKATNEEKSGYGYIERGIAQQPLEDLEDDDSWIVMTIHEVPDTKYYLVWYHAYDGVDFQVRGYDDLTTAQNIMKSEYEMVKLLSDDNVKQRTNEMLRVLDTGNEWQIWAIVPKFKEFTSL